MDPSPANAAPQDPRGLPSPGLRALNFILFQLGWLACAYSMLHRHPGWGVCAVLAVVMIHLGLCRRPLQELRLILLIGVVGMPIDMAQFKAGLIVPLVWHPVATPMWFFALYALLATTLNASLGWLRGRPVLAAVLGAIGGPLAYYAGARIGAITLTGESLAVLGILWAGLMPGMIWTSRRIN